MSEHTLAGLRQLLAQPASSNLWWSCLDLLKQAKPEEQTILRDYLLNYVQLESSWDLARVPCGDWKARDQRKKLCKVSQHPLEVEGTSEVVEVFCPPGTFRMGASEGDTDAESGESPARNVTLTRGFWALSTPVTQGLYAAVVGSTEYDEEYKTHPVYEVSWFQACEFCNQLSALEGLEPAYEMEDEEVRWKQEANGYRLPTEAEWEYMARAGSTKARYGELSNIGWSNTGEKNGHPVGEKKPNAWGLYDTLGNVLEVCWDVWQDKAFATLPDVDPVVWSHPGSTRRVSRGGCWYHDRKHARVSSRFNDEVHYTGDNVGFRIVRTGTG